MTKMKKVFAKMVSFVMTLFLFSSLALTGFAAEIALTVIPDNNETAENTYVYGEKATIKGTSVKIYKDLYYGAPGIEVEVAESTEIDLITAYSFSNGAVVYRFDYWGKAESPALYDAVLDYCFISADDLVKESSEVTPEPSPEVIPEPEEPESPEETPEEESNGIVDFGSMDVDMYVSPRSLTLYSNHIDDVDTKTVNNVKGQKVHVYFFYELEDGTVKYKVEYTGSNRSLKNAIANGYEFINSDDLYTKSSSKNTWFGWR